MWFSATRAKHDPRKIRGGLYPHGEHTLAGAKNWHSVLSPYLFSLFFYSLHRSLRNLPVGPTCKKTSQKIKTEHKIKARNPDGSESNEYIYPPHHR